MLHDFNTNSWQIKSLPAFTIFSVKCAGVPSECCSACRATDLGPDPLLVDAIRAVGWEQSFTGMTVLPTGLAPGLLPQTLWLGWQVEAAAIRRRRATTVAVGNRVGLGSSSRTLASSASTRSHSLRTKSAMTLRWLLSKVVSCSRLRRSEGTKNSHTHNYHSRTVFPALERTWSLNSYSS